MAKIGEPPAVRAPTKKRGWTATLPRRPPFPPSGRALQSRAGTLTSHTSNSNAPSHSQTGMRSLAERYRALAAAHYSQSKRRKLAAVARCERDAARVAKLTTLQSMARNTFNFCTEALHGEASNRREGEREKREAEEELRRAAGERRAAERFLNKLGISSKKQRAEDDSMDEDEGDDENSGETGNALIGGIPSKFLDLSHFPRLRKMVKRQNEAAFSPTKSDTHPSGFIDCTEEAASPARYPLRNESYPSFDSDGNLPMRIPSFGFQGEPQGIPQEVALTGNSQKGNAARVCVSCASLPHVNGTYLQEGSYNNAPLFVRVGPPRKFMGKWDCRVVLRRERAARSASGEEGRKPVGHNIAGEGEEEYMWKIGLVPAHRVAHPRLIGYFVAAEGTPDGMHKSPAKRVSNADWMDEDEHEEDTEWEPPAEGWRACQEGVGGGNVGRASGLRVSCEKTTATDRARSAADYESELSLRAALTEPPFFDHDPQPVAATDLPVQCTFNAQLFGKKVGLGCCDWQTATLDLASSHPQSVEEEVKRLMELKEYSILDAEHEEKFERITALASRIFDVPICLVSLVDIGRQWFMSNRGLGEVRETSREVSFCAHAILSKQDVFIVPDTYEDPRFKDNGLVTGPPFIRFYAGVPLVSPNGYKLGTFCIIDRKPRPNGLSLTDKQNLRELTDMVMDTMVHRKQEMERVMDEKTRLIACAAHDLLSPLTGIRLNLGLLMEDEGLQKRLDANQRELMEASVQCSDVIERICVGAIESFRGERPTSPTAGKEKGEVAVAELVENIDRVMGTYPKKVPFFIEKDDNVPPAFISDDLKLFRSVMNYLTNACKNAKAGSIKLRIYVRKADDEATPIELDLLPGALVAPKDDVLVMEVHDAGPGIALEKYPTLFTQVDQSGNGANDRASRRKKARTGLGLYSVATEISSLGGEYGVFPRQDLVASHPDLDDADNGLSVSGCVFWLSIPLVLPTAASPVTSPAKKEASPEQTAKVEDLKLMAAPIPKKRPADTVDEGEGASSEPAKKEAKVEINASAGEITEPLAEAASEPEPSKRAKRVLIIDDSLTIRKALSRGFSRLDFEVDEAENGLQGFKKLKSGIYEIVVLDFLMPVMDGPEVARKIRAWEVEHRPDFHQYIVGISAHANGKDAELGIKAGMDRFMSKPVPLKSLKDLAQSKPVMEASAAIDVKLKRSSEDIEAVSKIAEEKSDEEQSRSSRSSTTTSTFTKHSALLAVEDQPTLQSLQRIVEKYGWRAVVVSNGEDALRLLKLRKWDAAIIDNDLPVFSGTNCLIRFRDWETHSRAVRQKNIFILSDSYSPTSAPSSFDGALAKPLEPKQILSTLEAAGKNTLTPSIVALRSSFTSH